VKNASILKLLNRIRPEEIEGLLHALPTTFIGAGVSRNTFHISNSRWVIKFPMPHGIGHSRREIKVIKAITNKKRFRHLARYRPKVLYLNSSTGVVVIEQLHNVDNVPWSEGIIIERMFQDTLGTRANIDLSYSNMGYNGRGQIKIADFGGIVGVL
jgi:hypothetical protein